MKTTDEKKKRYKRIKKNRGTEEKKNEDVQRDVHHHNFFLYSYCLRIKDACTHTYMNSITSTRKELASR
jgi:hypothetical protein